VTFEVSADAYARFMGQYSEPLAVRFMELAGVRPGQRALDVGCGPGVLTAPLVERLGEDAVSAIDPSESFVAAARSRFPGVDVRSGVAEHLPYSHDTFDASLAQLVVQFMDDPVAGLSEMGRVTRTGGVVAASVWDHGPDGGGPLATFWRAVHEMEPDTPGESELPGTREGDLSRLCEAASLQDVEETSLTVTVAFATFDQWWEPYTLGVGPAGAHVAKLDRGKRDALRAQCARLLPPAPFEVAASAWCVRARA
jgi:SAM-dependent methyltransferase